MKCQNHEKKNSVGTCVDCGGPFCADCMVKAGRKNLCKDCASEQLKEHHSSKRSSDHPNIVVTQQTTHQSSSGSDKPRGSGFWLCFWIIVFWPAAIVYYLVRRWN